MHPPVAALHTVPCIIGANRPGRPTETAYVIGFVDPTCPGSVIEYRGVVTSKRHKY